MDDKKGVVEDNTVPAPANPQGTRRWVQRREMDLQQGSELEVRRGY